ncbi:MAG: LamG domain-containing protein, partial [Chlamydiia bacterium]|nr:LamG domain-containing protein [Chlamydiia bacterium]
MKKVIFTSLAIMLFSAGSYAQTLIHHLPLTSDAADIVGSLNGTTNNVVIGAEGAEFTGSWDDATLSYINIPSFVSGKSAITVSVWFKPEYDDNHWRALYALGESAEYHLRFLPSNGDGAGKIDIGVRVQENGQNVDRRFRRDFILSQNEWHQSVITITPTKIISYIDGIKTFVVKPGVSLFSVNDIANKIGGNFYKDPFMGKMKDFKVYDDIVNDDEVAKMFVESNTTTDIVGAYSVTSITQTSASYDASLNKTGTVYVVHKDFGSAAPDATEMKASTSTIDFASGEENTIKRIDASTLVSATKYDVYYMGVSTDGNSETAITKVQATTLADNTIVYKWPLESDVLEANGSGKDATIDGTVNFVNDATRGKDVAVLEDGFLKLPSVIKGINETTIAIWFRTDENRIWSKLLSFGRGGQTWNGDYREGLWLTPYSDIDGGEAADPLFFEYSGLDEDNNWTITDPWIKGVHTSHPAVGEWHHF